MSRGGIYPKFPEPTLSFTRYIVELDPAMPGVDPDRRNELIFEQSVFTLVTLSGIPTEPLIPLDGLAQWMPEDVQEQLIVWDFS